MEIKVPREIQVGGHTYRVLLSKDGLRDECYHGVVNHRTQEIRINAQRPASQRAEAFLHEILHVVDIVYGQKESKEEIIHNFGEGLTQALCKGLDIELDWSDIPEEE